MKRFDILHIVENATADDYGKLKDELITLSGISFHENIVNLIGANTSEDGW